MTECHDVPTPPRTPSSGAQPSLALQVLVLGNPNVGKTTLINALAGTRLQVGNWSGVTVEKREATLWHKNREIQLTDLPGAYSLNPHTPEELITRSTLLSMQPHVLLVVLDAGNLERNLFLTLQLQEFALPMVIALNLIDEAHAKGLQVEAQRLAERMGVEVVPMIASKHQGLDEVLTALTRARVGTLPSTLPEPFDGALQKLMLALSEQADILPHTRRYIAQSLLEDDASLKGRLRATGHADIIYQAEELCQQLAELGHDPALDLAELRYQQAHDIAGYAIPEYQPRLTLTDKLDRWVLHPWLGIPIFLGMVLLVFRITFNVASPFVDLIGGPIQEIVQGWFKALLAAVHMPHTLEALVTGAIVPGVGTVLSFLPTLLALYLAMGFLEDSGYMARAAFLADRLMRSVGLDGKAFIPMILGFGCNVPAVYATRTLENPRDRVLVSMILPFMSCSARLPVYVVFSAALFPQQASWVVWGLYILGIVVAIFFAWFLRQTMPSDTPSSTLLELPPYRLPTVQVMWKHGANRTRAFVKRAGTTVLMTVVVVWVLLATPAKLGEPFANIPPEQSLFGVVSTWMSPVFAPLGFGNWQATGALIPGFVAKEVVVGTLGQIYLGEKAADIPALGLVEGVQKLFTTTVAAVWSSIQAIPSVFAPVSLTADTSADQGSLLVQALSKAFAPAAGLAYLVFVLLYTPCIATVGAIAAEHGRRIAYITVVYQLVTAWLLAWFTFMGANALW